MKIKTLGLAALSLLFVATSCNKESVESSTDGNNDLVFKAVVGNQTRASEFLGTSWNNGNTLIVKGYTKGSTSVNPFFDKTLTFAGTAGVGTWSYTDAVKQPGYTINYHSWYPATPAAFSAASNGTAATMDYTVQIVGSQQDLIAATASTDLAAVTLTFKHILSQVNFAIQGVKDVQVVISNLTINDVKEKGTYTFSTTGGSWALTADVQEYIYDMTTYGSSTTGADATIKYLGNGNGVTNRNNALMLMPQTFAAGNAANFSFDFVLKDMSGVTLKSGNTSAKFCDFSDATAWAMGKRYVYIIDFTNYLGGGNITFDVVVDPWANATPIAAQALQVTVASKASLEGAIASHNTAKGATTALTVFPISMAVEPGADITVDTFPSTVNFEPGDEIRIQLPSTTNVAKIKLDVTGWTRSESGSTVTFTMDEL